MEQSYNLGVDNKHIHPGSFQVNHLRLYPHNVEFMPPEDLETEGQSSAGNPTKEEKNKFANILGAVKSFSIAEGIYQPTLFGELIIVDATNMIENYRIQGGEKVEISVQQTLKDKEKVIEAEFYISEIVGIQKVNIGGQTYKISLVTKEFFTNSLKKENSPFHAEPTELIKNLVQTHFGKELTVNGKGGPIIKGIYPKLRPFDAINFILRNSNDTQTPLFFYQGVKDGYHLKSYKSILDSMNEGDPEEEVWNPNAGIYSKYDNKPFGLPKTQEDETYYDTQRKKIQKIVFPTYADKLNLSRKGVYKSRMQIVDLDNKKMTERDFTYDDKDLTLNKNLTISDVETSGLNKFNDDDYKNSRNFFIGLNDFSKHLPENLLKTVSVYENLSDMKAEIALFGDPDLVPSAVIDLELYKDQPEDSQTKDENPDNALLGGKYLVTGITHTFSSGGYNMLVQIARDSSKIDFNEKVQL